jgi:hypothetical protein
MENTVIVVAIVAVGVFSLIADGGNWWIKK